MEKIIMDDRGWRIKMLNTPLDQSYTLFHSEHVVLSGIVRHQHGQIKHLRCSLDYVQMPQVYWIETSGVKSFSFHL